MEPKKDVQLGDDWDYSFCMYLIETLPVGHPYQVAAQRRYNYIVSRHYAMKLKDGILRRYNLLPMKAD